MKKIEGADAAREAQATLRRTRDAIALCRADLDQTRQHTSVLESQRGIRLADAEGPQERRKTLAELASSAATLSGREAALRDELAVHEHRLAGHHGEVAAARNALARGLAAVLGERSKELEGRIASALVPLLALIREATDLRALGRLSGGTPSRFSPEELPANICGVGLPMIRLPQLNNVATSRDLLETVELLGELDQAEAELGEHAAAIARRAAR